MYESTRSEGAKHKSVFRWEIYKGTWGLESVTLEVTYQIETEHRNIKPLCVRSNCGKPYAGNLHVRFLEEFISTVMIERRNRFTYEYTTY